MRHESLLSRPYVSLIREKSWGRSCNSRDSLSLNGNFLPFFSVLIQWIRRLALKRLQLLEGSKKQTPTAPKFYRKSHGKSVGFTDVHRVAISISETGVFSLTITYDKISPRSLDVEVLRNT